MTIHFYQTNDPKNKLNKTLQNEITTTGTLKNSTNILNPKIILKKTNELNFNVFNYCYIPDFLRFYFIENIAIMSNNLFSIDLKIDVLTSYKTELLNSFILLKTSTNYFNPGNATVEKNNDINFIKYEIDDTSILNTNGNILLVSQK